MYSKLLICFCVLHFYLLIPKVYGDDDSLVDSLGKALDSWLSQTEFKCSYLYTEEVVSDEKTASQYPKASDQCPLKCNGIFVKMGTKSLLSQNIQRDVYEPTQSINGIWMVSNVFAANYIPEMGKGQPNTLWVSERDQQDKEKPCPSVPGIVCIKPLDYTSGPDFPNPVSLMRELQQIDTKSKIVATKIGDKRVKLSLSFEESNGNKNEYSVVISTEYSFPVPVETTAKVIYRHGGYHLEKCEANDFIEVGNGMMVPQRITSYSGPLKNIYGPKFQGKWKVQTWFSQDLGKNKPSHDDFIIRMSPDTKYYGFIMKKSEKLKKEKPDAFDFNTLVLQDLQNPKTIAPVINNPGSNFVVRGVLFIFGVLLIAIACKLLWKKHHAQKNHD